MTGIKYIGGRETHEDNLYGTKLVWTPDQVHNVDDVIAQHMLKHTDVYEEAKPVKGEKAAKAVEEVKPEKPYIPLPHLEGMSKPELSNFAEMHYGERLPESMNLADARHTVQTLIQSKGR